MCSNYLQQHRATGLSTLFHADTYLPAYLDQQLSVAALGTHSCFTICLPPSSPPLPSRCA